MTCLGRIWLGAFALVAGCASPSPAPQFEVGPTETADISIAVDAFEDICLATAPDFVAGFARLARNGFTRPVENGVVFDRTGTLSIRLGPIDGPRGMWLRCSLVYQDPNRYIARERVDEMVAAHSGAIGPGTPSAFTDPAREGGREGRTWAFDAGGETGELLDVPSAGRGTVGALVLQFPVD